MNENGKENELMQYVTVLPRYTGMLHMKFLCKYFFSINWLLLSVILTRNSTCSKFILTSDSVVITTDHSAKACLLRCIESHAWSRVENLC